MADSLPMPGTLYVVATPIGNLEDLTFRALRVLKEVDVVAAEDTRRSRHLLTHYGISKPVLSLHEHNEHREAPRIAQMLAEGRNVALVSDAGTPGISDPGAGLVRAARSAGVRVVPIPGASAVTAALSVSGWAVGSFVFAGFPPRGGSARAEWFSEVAAERRAVVAFEAPHRFGHTFGQMAENANGRQLIASRELTKIHEEFVEWPSTPTGRGEFVILLGPAVAEEKITELDQLGVKIAEHLSHISEISDDAKLQAAAAGSGGNLRRIRKLMKQARYFSRE